MIQKYNFLSKYNTPTWYCVCLQLLITIVTNHKPFRNANITSLLIGGNVLTRIIPPIGKFYDYLIQ